jgi:hypothetical protein
MIWRTLNENNKYEVSNTGVVRRKDTQRNLSGCITSGYRSVKLTFENSKQQRFYVHRLVAEHFITNPDPKNKTFVNHKDGNKLNNNAENLEWVSPRENNLHYYQKIKKRVKEKKSFEKAIPVIQYDLQHNKIAEYTSMSQAHKATGVSVVQIARCVHGEVEQANGFIWEEGSTTTWEQNPSSPVRNTPRGEDIV